MTSTLAPGLAVVVPGARRAEDLHEAVEGLLATLDEAGRPAHVVIVDDARRDATSAEAEWLRWRHPDRVEVIRHDLPLGHDEAVRRGVGAALAHSEHPAVLIAEADGVPYADLADLLDDVDRERTGLVAGPGFELVDRRLLADLADGPAVQRQLEARVRDVGARAVERDTPRALPTARRLRAPRGRDRRPDRVLIAVTLGAVALSVIATVRALAAGVVLTYPDAVAHLLIARRVLESPTPGAAQLGAVWLPLPHVLAAPLAALDPLYSSGLAGAVVSMAAYVLCVRYVYQLVDELVGTRPAAVVAALVVALCPNVLYLQSTPMTELPLLCGLAGGTYYLVRWCRTARHVDLAAAAVLAVASTLVRYEAWVYVAAMAVVVVVTAWRRRPGEPLAGRLRYVEAYTWYFGLLAFVGIACWLVWNAVIFRDVLFFYDGPYAAVGLLPQDIADGDWRLTLLTYWYAVTDNLGAPLAVAGAVGLVLLAVRTRMRPATLAALTPAVLLPFFLLFLVTGSRPLRVLELTGMRYNVRFGLVMVIPVAIAVGVLVAQVCRLRRGRWTWPTAFVAALLVAAAAAGTASGGIATLQEAQAFRARPQSQADDRVAAWLRTGYTGGTVLMDTPGNETVVGDSGLPTREVVYDGSFRRWEPALARPAQQGIDWIYMRGDVGDSGSVGGLADGPDRVWDALEGSPQLAGYALVYDRDDRRVYHRVGR